MITTKHPIKTIKYLFLFVLGVFMFASCNSSSESSMYSGFVDYKSKGDSISIISQQVLLSNVSREMKAGGPVQALEFCNVNASGIMDSLSSSNNVKISRITDLPRNENNMANQFELNLLNSLKKSGVSDTLIDNDQEIVYYKSIHLGMSACLKCHGGSEDISQSTFDIIKHNYPNDLAFGYRLGDYRGAWKVEFNK